MRKAFRRHAFGIALCLAGLVLALAGTAASLGYVDLPGTPRETVDPVAAEKTDTGGVELRVNLDVDGLPVAVAPVTAAIAPPELDGLPLPGVSVDRSLDLDQTGLDARANLDLASGSHRVKGTEAPAFLETASTKAVLAPGVAPVAAAAAAFTLAGLLTYFWTGIKTWGLRLLVFPLLPLYAKISLAEVFDNSVRERIFAAIRQNPGVSASDLSRLANVSWGTTIYHLDVLEQTRMVSSIRNGRYRRYFENGAQLTATKEAVSILQNPVSAQVVETLRARPGVTQKELAGATNMTPQALHWHLARLVGAGLVRKEREGRVVRHFLG